MDHSSRRHARSDSSIRSRPSSTQWSTVWPDPLTTPSARARQQTAANPHCTSQARSSTPHGANTAAHPRTASDTHLICSPWESHQLIPLDEYTHQMVVLRAALLLFENSSESYPCSRDRGLRYMEADEGLFDNQLRTTTPRRGWRWQAQRIPAGHGEVTRVGWTAGLRLRLEMSGTDVCGLRRSPVDIAVRTVYGQPRHDGHPELLSIKHLISVISGVIYGSIRDRDCCRRKPRHSCGRSAGAQAFPGIVLQQHPTRSV